MLLPRENTVAKENPSPAEAPQHLVQINRLIAAKQASLEPDDGRLQVALAIAATTNLVTVDSTTTPFETDPNDLFDRTFNDQKVGLSDDQMAVFKANLTVLLPSIASDIDQIPENAALPIDKVAKFVKLALLGQSNQ